MKAEDILSDCNPGIDLSEIESQYIPFIEKLIESKKQKLPSPSFARPAASDTFFTSDLGDYVNNIIQSEGVHVFKPIELLSRIHKTIFLGEGVGYKESSRDMHYIDENGLETFKIESPVRYTPEGLKLSYSESVNKFVKNNPSIVNSDVATSADIIAINRRLIEYNIRCIRCRRSKIKCFKYDWISRKVL